MTPAERIKEKRESYFLLQEEVADLLKVDKTAIEQYESEENKEFDLEVIEDMAGLFDCNPAYLMGWIDDEAYGM